MFLSWYFYGGHFLRFSFVADRFWLSKTPPGSFKSSGALNKPTLVAYNMCYLLCERDPEVESGQQNQN